jgi:UDP-N-acetylglucosamine--N-acetylmuramyl-(pentapeptide) pyrophosphoryl-undecaprenol N-acetylglucosamine transferase
MAGGSIVIAAAGTGGHIYPGLALADAITRLAPDQRIVFTGTRRGLESTLIPRAGYELDMYAMVPFSGRRRWATPFVLPWGVGQARRILRKHDARAAVTMGGYGGLPLAFASRLARIPLAIHESGAVAGRANVLAAKVTRNVAVAFDSVASEFAHTEAKMVGMPLGEHINGFDRDALRPEARRAFGLSDDQVMIFVTGGSQGARSLNRSAIELAERWSRGPHARPEVKIVLKTGSKLVDEVAADLEGRNLGTTLEAVNFLDRIDHAYAAADIIVSRCGAGSVAEIAVAGLPAVFVPYPGAIDDHQALNAKPLIEAGAATLVRDAEACGDRLAAEIDPLIDDAALRAERSKRAASLGRPNAAQHLAEWVLDVAEGRG